MTVPVPDSPASRSALPPPGTDPEWYKRAVFYEVLVRGFADSNADGIGDLRGMIDKLDYLQWLGVDCLWLPPFFASPLRDGGYDVSDYTAVLPEFGDIEDFKEFLEAAHARGMRVIIDFVMNHTSDQHPWFQASRSDPEGPYGDFYVWADDDTGYADAPGVGVAGVVVGPDVEVAVGTLGIAAAGLEPGGLVRGVVHDEVDDHAHAAGVGRLEELLEVLDVPELGQHRGVVADVVATVAQGRGEERRQPEAVDAEPLQVVELVHHAAQVADAVGVAVGEASDEHLVEDRALVPLRVGAGRGECRPAGRGVGDGNGHRAEQTSIDSGWAVVARVQGPDASLRAVGGTRVLSQATGGGNCTGRGRVTAKTWAGSRYGSSST